MPEDVKVPGVGNVDKKYVIAGVVVGIGVAVVVYIRAKKNAQNAATASTATAGTVTDPAGNQCSALDPNSGYCPGTPEDMSYQSQYASSGYGGNYGYPASDYGGYASSGTSAAGLVQDPAGNQCVTLAASGYCPGTPQDLAAQESPTLTGGVGTGTPTAPTTNSQWLTEALAALPGDSGTNQAALAAVLGGVAVTTAQKNIFLEAIALVGNPPGGYPAINTTDTSAHPGTQTPGKTAGDITGLLVLPSGSGMQAKWNPSAGATGGYAWALTGPESKSGNTTGTVVTVHNLKKGTYNFGIQALPGGRGNNGHVTVG